MSRYRLWIVLVLTSFVDVFLRSNVRAQSPKLDLNDVSWLWPVATTNAELTNTISMGSLSKPDGTPVWSDAQFQSTVDTVVRGWKQMFLGWSTS